MNTIQNTDELKHYTLVDPHPQDPSPHVRKTGEDAVALKDILPALEPLDDWIRALYGLGASAPQVISLAGAEATAENLVVLYNALLGSTIPIPFQTHTVDLHSRITAVVQLLESRVESYDLDITGVDVNTYQEHERELCDMLDVTLPELAYKRPVREPTSEEVRMALRHIYGLAPERHPAPDLDSLYIRAQNPAVRKALQGQVFRRDVSLNVMREVVEHYLSTKHTRPGNATLAGMCSQWPTTFTAKMSLWFGPRPQIEIAPSLEAQSDGVVVEYNQEMRIIHTRPLGRPETRTGDKRAAILDYVTYDAGITRAAKQRGLHVNQLTALRNQLGLSGLNPVSAQVAEHVKHIRDVEGDEEAWRELLEELGEENPNGDQSDGQ